MGQKKKKKAKLSGHSLEEKRFFFFSFFFKVSCLKIWDGRRMEENFFMVMQLVLEISRSD